MEGIYLFVKILVFVKILSKSKKEGRKEGRNQILRSAIASTSHLKTVVDLPRQVIFLSCSPFFVWYFCCSSLSWNKTISNLMTLYWGHICKRSKGRVINLLTEVFSVSSQCGIRRRVDKIMGKERMVANLGCVVEEYPSSTFHPFSGISATK